MKIDVATVTGATYEDQYSGWLHVFLEAYRDPSAVLLSNVPLCWVPLLHYAGVNLDRIRTATPDTRRDGVFGHLMDAGTRAVTIEARQLRRLRELVEMSATLRPELVDALYKIDTEWLAAYGDHRRHDMQNEFVVTSTSSFQRPEVVRFIEQVLPTYAPPSKYVVLVPCAADKPYPAPLHKAVREVLSGLKRPWYQAIATGVLGIVPEAAWPVMPRYDSGIPNRWRLMHEVRRYFTQHPHTAVVSYCDFYNEAIGLGVHGVPGYYAVVNHDAGGRYVDLLNPDRLQRLVHACEDFGSL